MVEKLVPDSFLRNQNCGYLWINNQFVFVVCQVEDYSNILKLSCKPLLSHIKLFKK